MGGRGWGCQEKQRNTGETPKVAGEICLHKAAEENEG